LICNSSKELINNFCTEIFKSYLNNFGEVSTNTKINENVIIDDNNSNQSKVSNSSKINLNSDLQINNPKLSVTDTENLKLTDKLNSYNSSTTSLSNNSSISSDNDSNNDSDTSSKSFLKKQFKFDSFKELNDNEKIDYLKKKFYDKGLDYNPPLLN
jgi:hypothetical protein